MLMHCAVCGKQFEGGPSRRTCSHSCRGRWAALTRKTPARPRIVRPPRACQECGTSFVPSANDQRFCSKRCVGVYAGRRSGTRAPHSGQHWNWRGGGKPYHTWEWHRRRDEVRERDGWRCIDCGRDRSDGGRLNVHHLVSRNDWGERPGHPDDATNLVTLCTACHKRRHGWPERQSADARRAASRAYYLAHREQKLAYAKAYAERRRAASG